MLVGIFTNTPTNIDVDEVVPMIDLNIYAKNDNKIPSIKGATSDLTESRTALENCWSPSFFWVVFSKYYKL